MRFIAIAQLPGFMHARARAAGHRRPAKRAVGQRHIHFNRRIAAAIENLPAMNFNNFAHSSGVRCQVVKIKVFSRDGSGLVRAPRLHCAKTMPACQGTEMLCTGLKNQRQPHKSRMFERTIAEN